MPQTKQSYTDHCLTNKANQNSQKIHSAQLWRALDGSSVQVAFKSVRMEIITSPVIYFYFCIHKPIKSDANVIQIGMSSRKNDCFLVRSLQNAGTLLSCIFLVPHLPPPLCFAPEGMWIMLLRYWSWQAVAASGSSNSITRLRLINGDCARCWRTSAQLGSCGDPLQWLFLL